MELEIWLFSFLRAKTYLSISFLKETVCLLQTTLEQFFLSQGMVCLFYIDRGWQLPGYCTDHKTSMGFQTEQFPSLQALSHVFCCTLTGIREKKNDSGKMFWNAFYRLQWASLLETLNAMYSIFCKTGVYAKENILPF